MEVIAFTAERRSLVNLHGFVPTPIVTLQLREGLYIVFGKVAFINFDGDPQDAHARLRQSDGSVGGPFDVLDETFIRIPGVSDADRMAASVQAGVTVTRDNFLEIACDTFAGGALDAQLAAIHVDQLIS